MSALADRLLTVTAGQVHELGAPAVTVRGARRAAEVGVSPAAIYLHYRSRDHLLDQASAYAFRGLEQHLLGGSVRPTINSIVEEYARAAMRSPHAYQRLTQSAGPRPSAWTALLAPLAGALNQALRPGSAEPFCQPVMSLVAAAHGAVTLHLAGCLPLIHPAVGHQLAGPVDRLAALHHQESSCTA